MMTFINFQEIAETYRRQAQQRRITSGEIRLLALRKEEERLNGQTS